MSSLFRQEALDARDAQFLGTIRLGRNPSHTVVAFAAAVLAFLLVGYTIYGEFTRKARLVGILAPTLGALNINAPQAGTLFDLQVAEGDGVHAGQALMTLNTDRATARGDAAELISQSLQQRRLALQAERAIAQGQARQHLLALAERVRSMRAYALTRWLAYAPFREASAERLAIAARESSHFLETLRAITPLKLFGREEQRHARWQNLVVDIQNRDVRTAKMNIAFSTSNTLLFGLENLLVFWLGARAIMAAQAAPGSGAATTAPFTVGMLFAYVSYKGQFSSRVSALINYLVELKMLGLHAERLADIALAAPERDRTDADGIDANLPRNDLDHLLPCLELRGVSFRYGVGEPWVLKDANFKVDAGDSVAITGASGCGKTTLLKIMLGLLQPTEGEVLYGGVPVRQLGLANVRRQLGTVMQDDVLLTGSLADNISFFDLAADRARIDSCARLSLLTDEIARMPMGLQTLVGDLGTGLSGGQKQRILLARALYKKPRVLALDEATSHLDVGNERAVTQALTRMRLTRLIIAHRPETIAGAQRVVQMREGKVHEVARVIAPTDWAQRPEPLGPA